MFRLSVVILTTVVLILTTVGWTAPTGPRMPDVSKYELRNRGLQHTLPCGEAWMEVRGPKGGDIVVWKLNTKILGVVFTRQMDYIGLWDYDFNGIVDSVTIRSAGSNSVTEEYKKVRGCEKI